MKKKLASKLKRYDKQINSYIPKDYPHRREIISSIRQDISSYVSEHPDIFYEDIIEHFGTPEEMTLSFAESLSMEDIVLTSRRQRKIHAIFISISIILLGILSALIIYYYRVIMSEPVGIDEIIIIYPETDVDEKDSILETIPAENNNKEKDFSTQN